MLLIPAHLNVIDRHHHSVILRSPLCWLNQSGNNQCDAHIRLIRGSWFLHLIRSLCVRFIVSAAVVFAVIWITQVTIAVMPLFSVQSAMRSIILITVSWKMVNLFYLADSQCTISAFMEVLC